MNTVEQTLANWKSSLVQTVEIRKLIDSNPIAHKWKATFHHLLLREAVFWRLQDLLTQSYALTSKGTHSVRASCCAAALRLQRYSYMRIS